MQTNTYPLDQSSTLFISGILASGHEESAEPLPPMEDGPRFPLPRHCLAGGVPCAPRNYAPAYEHEETPDLDDDDGEEVENLLRTFARDKQGRDMSPDFLPSMRNRGAIRAELASMGCAWND